MHSICSRPASIFLKNLNYYFISIPLDANIEITLSIGQFVQLCQKIQVISELNLRRSRCAILRSFLSKY